MPASPPLLQFIRLPGYQTQSIPGSSWLYTIDPDRPIGYTAPSRLLTPTLPGGGVWRASLRDLSVPVAQLIAVDMGVYNWLGDAQTACQDNANLAGLNWKLVWLVATGYQSRAVPQFSWIYNITQPSIDSTGTLYWRATKRDASFSDPFATSIPIGNFTTVSDAMTACQNDFGMTYPPLSAPPPPVVTLPPIPLPVPPSS